MSRLLFAAIDVDDSAFHVAIFDPSADCVVCEFKTKPSAEAVAGRMKVAAAGRPLRACYESTYLGFSLKRQLEALDISTDVIAASLVPTLRGKRQKTDRLDSRRLAPLFAKGLLTLVVAPAVEDEAVRGLLRSRAFTVRQVTRAKNHIVKLLRREGIDFKAETKLKTLWTQSFRDWLAKKSAAHASPAVRITLRALLAQLEALEVAVKTFDDEVEAQSESERYKARVTALTCFRGIERTNALTIITELGDVRRFPHPKKLMGYVGLSVVEYSSGGTERRFGIAKTGNAHVRTALVEACQFALYPPRASARLRQRRLAANEAAIKIADRCMERLHRKGSKLLYRGKPRNKIKTALAREMVGFIWEALRQAS